ncbi:MAG: MFS transporter [Candidatus Kapaibacterium sp.]
MRSTRKERIAWYLYDWANSAFPTTVITVFIGPYLTSIAKNAAGPSGNLSILGFDIFAGSYFPFIVSLSVLLQVIILPLAGAMADYTKQKKLFLGLFAYIGSFATMGLYFLEGEAYLYGGLLFIIANLSFGASIVFYNSFIVDLAEPDRRDSVSSIGWAIGYLGGGILLLLNLMLFMNSEQIGISESMAVRISLASAGAWWAIFTIAPLMVLKRRIAKQKIPENRNLFTIGFTQLGRTIKNAKNYPKTLIFLAAYLFYNDGVQAVIALSAQFGQEELGLEMSTLTQTILIVQFVAFGGALLFNYLARQFTSKKALLISLVIWSGAVIFAYGFLYSEAGFLILGVVIGLVLGGTQALSRSLYSLLIPEGRESEYFSLYEVSERGTSWLGPFIFGLALQFTGSYRIAILSLIVFFVVGFIMLLSLNIKKAIIESGNELPEAYK